ncbi:MAG: feruloyl-CoA synthase [Rhodospirillaceae bacterium]|nr:feruloyl-CoA synthase [Rhodospirillaceae bacterium]
MAPTPIRKISLATPSIESTPLADGGVILKSTDPLGPFETQLGELMRGWAEARPDTIFLAEREPGGGWRTVTYAEARQMCDAISASLLDRGLGPEKPVMLLSGNGIDHGLLSFGAMQVGIPVAPVSPAYSLMSADFAKVKLIRELVEPGLVYAASGAAFEKVLGAVPFGDAELVVSGDPPADAKATDFSDLPKATPGQGVEAAFQAVTGDHVAKYLFTSGSTGTPKGVINTQAMLCSNQQMSVQQIPYYMEVPPVMVDWLPWNHTFGGNYVLNLALKTGGSMYIDEGKPAPGLIEKTAANLKDIAPTAYYNVPAGYGMLLPFLERDKDLRENFFSRIGLIFYAAAALSADLWQRLESLAIETTGERIVMASAFGSTESAPLMTAAHWIVDRAGNVGNVTPGAEVKLAPVESKLEIRGRGPNITPGYLGRPDLTIAAFDEDGFFRFGDAMRLEDAGDAAKGMLFDGRVAEDFKLASGTWVHPGVLRPDLIAAAAPVIQDAVISGHDRDYIAALAWPNAAGLRTIAGAGDDADIGALMADEKITAHIQEKVAAHNQASGGGSSRAVRRIMLMAEPPGIDANEITDKGYVNQRATLERRADMVERLYAEVPDGEVIVID